MAIEAKFIANFDQFVAPTKNAEAALRNLETGSQQLGTTFTSTQANADRFRGSLQQFDGVLASLGVNIGAEVRALSELSTAAGKTASEMGLIATAGLAAGAAFAGWQIGRAISGFFDLDEVIGNATAKLLGWGDVAAQEAGAAADVLARASKVAGFEIKDMALAMALLEPPAKVSKEALKALAEETKRLEDVDKAASDAMHASNARKIRDHQTLIDVMAPFNAAMVELNSAGMGWQGTLDTIDGTVVEAIKHYLAAGVSQKALADAYGLTDAQVKSVASSLREDADATRRASVETDQLAASAADAADALDRERAAAARLKTEAAAARAEIEKLKKANREMGNSTEFDLSTDAGRAMVPENIRVWLHDGYSLAQASQIAFLMSWGLPINANDPLFRQKGPRVPGFAAGVENFAGGLAMVGERGPELVNLPGGSDVIPFGAGGAIVNNFYLVDNSENLARKTAQLIMTAVKRGQKMGLS